MDQILEKWDEILMTVKTEHDISDIAFNTFLRPLEFYGVTGNTAYILVPVSYTHLPCCNLPYPPVPAANEPLVPWICSAFLTE